MITRFLCCLLLTIVPFYAFAQKNADDAAKEKQRQQTVLIEQILGDVKNLKLAENRALVSAKVGNLMWKTDEKQARALFQMAIGELINAQTEAEADRRNQGYQNDLLTGQNTRPQILNFIASRDAELALEYLSKSRPAKISQALAVSSEKSSKINDSNYGYLAANETNLEQTFIRLAADQSPERAVKLLKESLKKGLSNETLSLLKKLHEKDATAADELASEIVGKLTQSGFNVENQPGYQNINIATNFLTEYIREKSATEKFIKFDDSQMRGLADKLISFCLQMGNGYYFANSILPIAEKLASGKVERIKQATKNNVRRGFDSGYDPEVNKLLTSEGVTAQKLLAEAGNYPLNARRQIYQTAANKFAEQGDFTRATETLSDNFSDEALEQAINSLNWQRSYSLIAAEKYAEAERVIDEFPENTRPGALVTLANAVYQKNPSENKSHAARILGKARASVAERPEDSAEMAALMQIISAYSLIEPAESFRLFEFLIPQINELSDAAVVIYGFQKSSNVKQNESLLVYGSTIGVYLPDSYVLGKLAASDFDRTLNLINNFSRREAIISLKLQLAEGISN